LLTLPSATSGRENDYWRALPSKESWGSYSLDLCRVLSAAIRAALDPSRAFKLPMSEEGQTEALDLYGQLVDETATWNSLHPLMREIWKAPDASLTHPDAQLPFLVYFLAAVALKEDGTLMDAGALVTWITHLKFAARAFCMVEGASRMGQSTNLLL
jgi:hypothetical protein